MFETGLSPVHVVVVIIVAILVFGPDKLPEMARKAVQLRREFHSIRDTIEEHAHGLLDTNNPQEDPSETSRPRPSDRGQRTWPPTDQ